MNCLSIYKQPHFMQEFEELFARLGRSKFRSRFRLGPRELAYLKSKDLPTILTHADDFIDKRLAPGQSRQ